MIRNDGMFWNHYTKSFNHVDVTSSTAELILFGAFLWTRIFSRNRGQTVMPYVSHTFACSLLDAKNGLITRPLIRHESMTLAIDHEVKFLQHGDV